MYLQEGMFNVALASLIVLLVWDKSLKRLLVGVFCYATFNFLYSVAFLNSYADLVSMHSGSGDVIVRITGAIFILFIFFKLIMYSYRHIFADRWINICFSTVMALVLIGFAFPLQLKTELQIQNFVSIEAMLMLLWLMYTSLIIDSPKIPIKPRWLHILNVVIFVALVIAFYEVFFQQAWAWYSYNDQLLFRASSFLFNPNLFGMWCAMLYLGVSFLFHRYDSLPRKALLLGLFLLAAGLYLSGSRSFIYLLILMLIILLPLIKGKVATELLTPLTVLLLTIFVIYSFSGLVASHSKSEISSSGWQSVELVGDRILAAPIDAVKYGLFSIGEKVTVDKEIVKAIEGRFKGQNRDSGILTIYDDMGWIGLLAMVGLSLIFFVWASKVYLIKRDATSAYALVMLLFCGGIGISMGYQVFPVWVFMAIALSPCLALWRTVLINVVKQPETNKSSVQIYNY